MAEGERAMRGWRDIVAPPPGRALRTRRRTMASSGEGEVVWTLPAVLKNRYPPGTAVSTAVWTPSALGDLGNGWAGGTQNKSTICDVDAGIRICGHSDSKTFDEILPKPT